MPPGPVSARSTNANWSATPSAASKGIETTGLIDNASNATRTLSVLLNSDGILKINGAAGNFSGTDADGNSVTIRRGTLSISTVANAGVGRSGLGRSCLGRNGHVQIGYGSTNFNKSLPYPCTLQYTGTSSGADRTFHLADQNRSCIEVTQPSVNLTLSTGITQTGTANGGGKLNKSGAGTLTFAGATTVNGGTLVLANGAALQSSTLATGSVAFNDSVASHTIVQANQSLPANQLNHEGHSGWTAAQLTAGNFLAPVNGVDSDVVLLQIGTNDLLAAGYTAQLQTNLETLLTQLTTNRPAAH